MALPDDERVRFKAALQRGSREECAQLVEALVAREVPLIDIYEVFRHGLAAVGEAWARGELSVAVEHRATAIVEHLMVDLFPRVVATEPSGRRAVSACVGSGLHQVGARMVADVLESLGWRCAFASGLTVPGELAALAQREHATLVALSVTLTENLPDLVREVESLRGRLLGVTLVAGGQALAAHGDQVCGALEDVTWVPDLRRLVTFTRGLG